MKSSASAGVVRKGGCSERRSTALLALALLAGICLAILAGPYRSPSPAAQGTASRQALPQTSQNAEADGPQADEAQAARQDAQGDQASDE